MKEVNWDILDEPLKKFNLPYTDDRTVRELVFGAVDRFYELDQKHFKILSVEDVKIIDTEAGPFKFVLDILAEIVEPDQRMAKLGLEKGDKVIIDWKTTAMNLNNPYGQRKFADTYTDSFQWKLYLSFGCPDAKAFVYRGISKEPDGGFTQLIVKPFDGMLDECTNYLKQYRAALLSQSSNGLLPWLKKMPDGCAKFDCKYVATCKKGTPAEYLVNVTIPEHSSYSGIETFQICPERRRRDLLEKVSDDDRSDAAKIGVVFHEQIALIYKELL